MKSLNGFQKKKIEQYYSNYSKYVKYQYYNYNTQS